MALPVFGQAKAALQPPNVAAEQRLTKFDLDFPGGTPGQLVSAIQKAMGQPLNAIIPSYYADRQLPPLKMSGVDVAQLFEALPRSQMAGEEAVERKHSHDKKTQYFLSCRRDM